MGGVGHAVTIQDVVRQNIRQGDSMLLVREVRNVVVRFVHAVCVCACIVCVRVCIVCVCVW